MSFIQTFLSRVNIIRLRKRIARAKSDHAHESLRMEFEFVKKTVKIRRLHEDNELALARAREDWKLESAYILDHIEDLETRLLGEICLADSVAAKKAKYAGLYGASNSKTLQMVDKDVA